MVENIPNYRPFTLDTTMVNNGIVRTNTLFTALYEAMMNKHVDDNVWCLLEVLQPDNNLF